MKNRVIALLQARTDSTRLPKKVLKRILNKPMIIHQLQRTSKSKLIDNLILLTSDETSDDELADIVFNNNFNVFRGSKNNVLKRFYDSVSSLNLKDNDIIVRLTGDCPLHDSEIIDEVINEFISSDCDYLTNSVIPVYPDGLDVEVFNYKNLRIAYNNAKLKSELEHVTPYIRNNKMVKVCNVNRSPLHIEWRLTVDEECDFKLINKIYKNFGSTFFSFNDILKFLKENPQLLELNSFISRNEGYLQSLKEDNDN